MLVFLDGMKQSREVFNGMINKKVDLVVIGAGATGSNVAYEATKRGMKVVLLDAGDIGGGTSCRSTKLLHGGVRYLELAFKTIDFAQLKLVKEALIERAHWIEHAPFLAKRLELAIATKNCLEGAYYRIGLGVYDGLAGKKNLGKSRFISNNEIKNFLPNLQDKFKGGVSYLDGQFDDARLNLLIALTAEKAGTIIKNYCKVIDFEKSADGKINGVISQDVSGQQYLWETNIVINATGIGSDKIRQQVDSNCEPRIVTSRGTHIVLNTQLCPKGLGLLSPSTDDGRVLFVLPFFGRTIVGTTDQTCSPENAFDPTDIEQQYLLNHLHQLFKLDKKTKIKSSWAGGRPLLKQNKEVLSSSNLIREHEIEIHPSGMISAMGGKWTTCRTIAMDTMKAIEIVLEKKLPSPKGLPLMGSKITGDATRLELFNQKQKLKEYLPDSNLTNIQINHLQSKYGVRALEIIEKSSFEMRLPISEVIPICKAELIQDITKEHVYTSTDLLARRSRLAMVDLEEAERLMPIINELLTEASLPLTQLNIQT